MPYSVEAHIESLGEFTAEVLSRQGSMDIGDWHKAWYGYNELDLGAAVPRDEEGRAQSIHNLAESVTASLIPVAGDLESDDIGAQFDAATREFMRAYAGVQDARLTDETLTIANGVIDVVVPKAVSEIVSGRPRHLVVSEWAGKLAVVRNAIIMTDQVGYWD
jgi:hypothetical protein